MSERKNDMLGTDDTNAECYDVMIEQANKAARLGHMGDAAHFAQAAALFGLLDGINGIVDAITVLSDVVKERGEP